MNKPIKPTELSLNIKLTVQTQDGGSFNARISATESRCKKLCKVKFTFEGNNEGSWYEIKNSSFVALEQSSPQITRVYSRV